MRSHLPHWMCVRPSQAFIPKVLADTLQFLNRSRPQLPNTFRPGLLNTQKQRDLSDPPVGDRHTYLRAFPDIVQITEAHVKHSSLSCRHAILPAVTQNLIDYRYFQPEICCVCSGRSLDTTLVHKAGLFSCSDRYLPVILYCNALAQTDVSMQTPCSAFISSSMNQSATKFIMHAILPFLHMAQVTTHLHLPPLSRIPWSVSTRSIRSALHFSLCHQSLSKFRFFCVPAHDELWTFHFFVKSFNWIPRELGPTSVPLRNFISGPRRACVASLRSGLLFHPPLSANP